MNPIKVIVHGAAGKVGQEVIRAVCGEGDMQMVGAVDMKAAEDSLPLPDGSSSVPFSTDLRDILDRCQADVMVDFSIAKATMPAVRLATEKGINLVIGTTGFSPDDIKEIERLAAEHGIGAVMAPNFALGAVLMMHLAKIAAKYLDYAEIIELHHHLKADAPSGTAQTTARAMAAARGKPFLHPQGKDTASRGDRVEGVSIHSVRLPGLMAHQEVILGAPGQTLSIRHDTINRECYMPGVMLAIREVVGRKGFVYGLDKLLGL
ncbi:MAG: 4-hydroxy-tetrahydrodipicolinate reductase [Dehalococcoidia bacterium]|nr:MAG: 4-hydroxy-tetrahydrodipicolinate reductase [Dehalococcoidia bacterium]